MSAVLPGPKGETSFDETGVVELPEAQEWPEGALPALPPGLATVAFTVPVQALGLFEQLYCHVFGAEPEATDEMNPAANGIRTMSGILDINAEKPTERFSDVGGQEQVVAQLRPIVEDIQSYRNGSPKLPLPRGMLFAGQEGVGKTHLARAFAGEAGCTFIYVNASNLLPNTQHSTSASAIQSVFAKVRQHRDSLTQELRSAEGSTGKEKEVLIFFLDRFESIASVPDSNDEARTLAKDNILDALLAEIGSIENDAEDGVIVIAAVDASRKLRRPDMLNNLFSHTLLVREAETTAERLDVLKKGTATQFPRFGVEIKDESALGEIAKVALGVSSAALRSILGKAAERAKRSERSEVTKEDLYDAFQEVIFGAIEDKNVSESQLEMVANHEHGHGFLALACGHTPMAVSMKPRGDSLGRVLIDWGPLKDPPIVRDRLLKLILVMAGGRAAELIKYGDGGMSCGVGSDFANMKMTALQMVSAGMIGNKMPAMFASEDGFSADPEAVEVALRICDRASQVACKVLEIVGRNRLDQIAKESLSLGGEIFSCDALRLHLDHIDERTLHAMKLEVERFLKMPLAGADLKGLSRFRQIKRGRGSRRDPVTFS